MAKKKLKAGSVVKVVAYDLIKLNGDDRNENDLPEVVIYGEVEEINDKYISILMCKSNSIFTSNFDECIKIPVGVVLNIEVLKDE